jgi:hypothetical protein
MYASCGWFFDDIAGVESMLILRQAAHVVDLWQRLGGRPPVAAFEELLASGRSNSPQHGHGGQVFRVVARDRMTPARAAAHFAFTHLEAPAARLHTPGFELRAPPDAARPGGTGDDGAPGGLISGRLDVTTRRTGERLSLAFTIRHDGDLDPTLSSDGERVTLGDLPTDLREPIVLAALARLAAGRPSAAACRAALALAPRSVQGQSPELEDSFARLAAALVGQLTVTTASDDALALVTKLVEKAGLPRRTPHTPFIEEQLWQLLAAHDEAKLPPPPALRTLADRLGFAANAPHLPDAESRTPHKAIQDQQIFPAEPAGLPETEPA